jgi:hypothetical protein
MLFYFVPKIVAARLIVEINLVSTLLKYRQ